MQQQSDERNNRKVKRDIKVALVTLPIISFLFGMIISFLYSNFQSVFKTDLTMTIFVAMFVLPMLVVIPGLFIWLKKLVRDVSTI